MMMAMKKMLQVKILSLMCMAACCVGVQAKGVLTWLESEHDFGIFNESEGRVKCVFRAVNTGTESVNIVRVMPTCGCTTGEYTRTPIAVGDTATVTLTYHATGRVGSFDKAAYVYTDTEQRKFTLHIRGNVLASKETVDEMYPYHTGALYYDRRTIPFGDVAKGASKMGYIGAYNNSADTLTVTFESVPEWLEMEAFPSQVPPFGLCTISGFFNSFAQTQWGLNTADIGLKVVQRGEAAKGTFDVVGIVNEDFSKLSKKELEKAPIAHISEDVVDFGTISVSNGVLRREFKVSNSGKSVLHIRRVYCGDKHVGLAVSRSDVKPGDSCVVSVAVNVESLSGIYLNSTLEVITNDPSHPKQEVRLVGIMAK